MDHKNKVLFVLHEGVGSTIFRSQVLEHVMSMEQNGITMSILTFETFRNAMAISRINLQRFSRAYCSIKIYLKSAVNIYLPISTFINGLLLGLYLFLFRNEYNLIHARSDYTAFLCLLSKPFHRLPVLWDCRGDAVDELRDALNRRSGYLCTMIGWALLLRQRFIVTCCRNFSDGVIFVSDELLNQNLVGLRTKNFSVIPCPVPEDIFFFDPDLRERARMRHSISPWQRVFIYSGSTVAYQGLDRQLSLYESLLSSSDNIIYFATTDLQYAREYFKKLPLEQFRIVGVDYNDMNEIYNLSDFAFMLRESKNLNWVASPTKFGEYCLAGLPVILNDTVEQASKNAKELKNYVHVDNILKAVPLGNNLRISISESAKKIYSRGILSSRYMDLYTKVTEHKSGG